MGGVKMQKKIKENPPSALVPSQLCAELRRGESGATVAFFGVVAISELSDSRITLKAHGGSLSIVGSSLSLSLFENRCAEISGRISQLEIGYGRG